jgi:hypothetical protein
VELVEERNDGRYRAGFVVNEVVRAVAVVERI